METKSNLASIYKKKYCQGNFDGCARYMVATTVGKEKVPSNMFPNMREKAEEIIAENN